MSESETNHGGSRHRTVLLEEAVDGLAVRPDGRYIDGTLGGGGHSRALLERLGPEGRLLALDRDPAAVERARGLFAAYADRLILVQGSFADLRRHAEDAGMNPAHGILLDLGISSDQLDTPERGFSFSADGPLDMRMDPGRGLTAADLVNRADEKELARILWIYGEERQSRRLAKAIVAARPLRTTRELADLIGRAAPGRRGRIHPATRTFQALRIAVNGELEALDRALEQAFELLAPGGRLAVISFHSLEDRRVKQAIRRHEGRMESLEQGGERWVGEEPRCRSPRRKPIVPRPEEAQANPRSRSAKLRLTERVHHG